MEKQNLFYYPGWTKKSITFTIDDANTTLDRKFIDIVRPAGFLGTFNITSKNLKKITPEEFRELYLGFEVSNHTATHPFLLKDDAYAKITDEPFVEAVADGGKIYKTDREGYYYFKAPNGWRVAASLDYYKSDVLAGHEQIEAVFGKGSVRSFVWPYTVQVSDELDAYIKSFGYYGIRASGAVRDREEFNLPTSRFPWNCTSPHNEILELGEKYDSLEDDGKLKFFCFGVHSHDFENNKRWHLLVEFAKRYGNRPNDFWYAPVGDIFAYEDAVATAEVTAEEIINNSSLTLYLKICGERRTVEPHSSIKI
ncbi:MAG: polysaccharide deacetylase family protein [Clostridia bacterium]|nr:polysaccharide deacetylase family protein [Clostridia bacterium]